MKSQRSYACPQIAKQAYPKNFLEFLTTYCAICTLITGGVGEAGADPPTCNIGTFFLCPWLLVPIFREKFRLQMQGPPMPLPQSHAACNQGSFTTYKADRPILPLRKCISHYNYIIYYIIIISLIQIISSRISQCNVGVTVCS